MFSVPGFWADEEQERLRARSGVPIAPLLGPRTRRRRRFQTAACTAYNCLNSADSLSDLWT